MIMKKSGFTLLEIIVSMLILSIVVAGSFGLFTTANNIIAKERRREQAYQQAAAILERLRYYVYEGPDSPLNNNDTYSNLDQVELRNLEISGDNEPLWEYTVSDVKGTECKLVTAKISWEEQ